MFKEIFCKMCKLFFMKNCSKTIKIEVKFACQWKSLIFMQYRFMKSIIMFMEMWKNYFEKSSRWICFWFIPSSFKHFLFILITFMSQILLSLSVYFTILGNIKPIKVSRKPSLRRKFLSHTFVLIWFVSLTYNTIMKINRVNLITV